MIPEKYRKLQLVDKNNRFELEYVGVLQDIILRRTYIPVDQQNQPGDLEKKRIFYQTKFKGIITPSRSNITAKNGVGETNKQNFIKVETSEAYLLANVLLYNNEGDAHYIDYIYYNTKWHRPIISQDFSNKAFLPHIEYPLEGILEEWDIKKDDTILQDTSLE